MADSSHFNFYLHNGLCVSLHRNLKFTAKFYIIYIYIQILGEINGKLPLRTCPGCSVPEPYRSPDWALVPAQTSPKADY